MAAWLCTLLLLLQVPAAGALITAQKETVGDYDGDILLAAFFPIHDRAVEASPSSGPLACGGLKAEDSIQLLEAFYNALDWVNSNASGLLPGVRLGAKVLDTCSDEGQALEQGVELLRFLIIQGDDRVPYRCTDASTPVLLPEFQTFHKIVGVLGGARSAVTMHLAALLRLFAVPQVSYLSTSSELSHKERYPYFARTVPSDTNQAKAIVQILKEFNWTYVSVVYDDSFYGMNGFNDLSRVAEEEGVCFSLSMDIDYDQPNWDDQDYRRIAKELIKPSSANVVVVFTQRTQARFLFEAIRAENGTSRGLVFVGSDAWSGRDSVTAGIEELLEGVITVQPIVYTLPHFDDYFTSLHPYRNQRNPWFREFWESNFNCSFVPVLTMAMAGVTTTPQALWGNFTTPDTTPASPQRQVIPMCTGEEVISSLTGYKQQLNLHFVHDAVSVYAHALHALHEELCGPGHVGLCPEMSPTNLTGQQIMDKVAAVNFTSVTGLPFNLLNGTDGPPRYSIMSYFRRHGGWLTVGNYSDVPGEEEFRFIPEFTAVMKSYPTSSCSVPCGPGQVRKTIAGDECCWICNNCTEWEIVKAEGDLEECHACDLGLRPDAERLTCVPIPVQFITHDNPWSLGVMVVSLVGIVMTTVVLVIFLRFFSTPVIKASGRELSLVLIVGIFLSFGTVFAITAPPSTGVCVVTRIMIGLSYTTIYASLFTKTNRIARIFTETNTSPHKTRFTSPKSQLIIVGVLVFGECLILAIWMASVPPGTTHYYPTREENVLVCKGELTVSSLVPIIYPLLLLLLCAVYAFKTRKTPDGFNETRYIGFTSYTTCVVWLAFLPFYFIVTNFATKAFVLAMVQALTALVSLACLFVPKVYICLLRPQKNTREAVMARSCSVNSASFILEPGGSNAGGTGNPAHNSSTDISRSNGTARPVIHSYHPGMTTARHEAHLTKSASGNHLQLPDPRAAVKRASSVRSMPVATTENSGNSSGSAASLRDITLRLQSPLLFSTPGSNNNSVKRVESLPSSVEGSPRPRSKSLLCRQLTDPLAKRPRPNESDV